MVDEDDLQDVMFATLSLHEAFVKFVASSIPAEIPTKTQMNIALLLHALGPQSMSALSRRMNVAPEQVTRGMRALREAGIVESSKQPDNKRVVISRLTEKGERLIEEHQRSMNERIAAYLESLPARERHRFVKACHSISGIFMAHDIDDPIQPIMPPRAIARAQREGHA